MSLWRVIWGLALALQIVKVTAQGAVRSGGLNGPRYGYDQAAFNRYAYDKVPGCPMEPADVDLASVPMYTNYDSMPMKFTGKERDPETGLDFFGARYMSSAQGRFTSPDRYNPMLIKQGLDAGGRA